MAAIFNRKECVTEKRLLSLLEMEQRKADRLEAEKLWFQYAKGKKIDLKYSRVSIYGVGLLGIELKRQLQKSDIQVICFVDKKPMDEVDSVKVYQPDDDLPHMDIMIVTPVYDYWDIRFKYVNKGFQVISILDILNGLIE